MIIGITYDLRDDYLALGYSEEETAEFDKLDTVIAIEQALRGQGFETDRIGNIRALAQQLVSGNRWDMVFNIAEGLKGFGREAQVPCLLEAFSIPYTFSDPLTLTLTLHKGMTKRIIHDVGIPTPDFFIIEEQEDIDKINLPFPLFVKPVAEGTGKGIDKMSIIKNREDLKYVCTKLLRRFNQHILVETYLPGREFTVGIVGNNSEALCLGVMEVLFEEKSNSPIYSLHNKENYKELIGYRLIDDEIAQRVKEISLASWKTLGCKDGGRVDVRTDENEGPYFLEVNPLAGLHPEHSDLPILCSLVGIDYNDLIGMIVRAALKRWGLDKSAS